MPSQAHSSTTQKEKSRKILIIDDNLFILNLIKNILRNDETILSTAQTGEEGYELACMQHPDVILLDRRLEDISGNQILQRIKSNPETEDIPVAMISSDGNDSDIMQSLDYGANDYIVKPFNAQTLVSKVKRLIEKGGKDHEGFFFV